MSEDRPFVKGQFVVGTMRRRLKSSPVKDDRGKIVGYQYSERDVQDVDFINKKGEHVKIKIDVTGRYGDQNYAERIPSKVVDTGKLAGKRRDKKKKKVWKDNVCHRISSYPGCEAGYTARLVREKAVKKLQTLCAAYIGQHGSNRGAGLDPVIKDQLNLCYAEGVEKRLIRRAMRGANV